MMNDSVTVSTLTKFVLVFRALPPHYNQQNSICLIYLGYIYRNTLTL